MNTWTLTARWIIPVDGPPLENGTVTIQADKFLSLQPHGTRKPDIDLGNCAILPGFVNAHTHLDLSGMRGKCPPTDPEHFTDWLRGVIAHRRTHTPNDIQVDVEAGVMECLRYGTTLIGDIAAEGQSWDVVAKSPFRAVVFRELLGLTEERAKTAGEAAVAWLRKVENTPTCRKALAPHAPYSARTSLSLGAGGRDELMSIHFAESPAELQLLQSKTGPFVKFLEALGVWDPAGLHNSLEIYVVRSRLVGTVLFAHCNYMPVEWCRYIAGVHTIVYCPRTHAAFGHPPHPFREFLARGVRVALGTDSLASNPDLDVLAEARFVRRHYPDVSPATILHMATLAGAEALGWADETGSITAGKSADLVVLPLPDVDSAEPYSLILESNTRVKAVLFRGRWTVGGS